MDTLYNNSRPRDSNHFYGLQFDSSHDGSTKSTSISWPGQERAERAKKIGAGFVEAGRLHELVPAIRAAFIVAFVPDVGPTGDRQALLLPRRQTAHRPGQRLRVLREQE